MPLFDRISRLLSYRNESERISREVNAEPNIIGLYSEEELEEDERERAGLEKRYYCPGCKGRMYAIAPDNFYCNACNRGYTKAQLEVNPLRNRKGHVKGPSESQIDEDSELVFVSMDQNSGESILNRNWTIKKKSPDGMRTEIHVKGDPSKLLPFGSESEDEE